MKWFGFTALAFVLNMGAAFLLAWAIATPGDQIGASALAGVVLGGLPTFLVTLVMTEPEA